MAKYTAKKEKGTTYIFRDGDKCGYVKTHYDWDSKRKRDIPKIVVFIDNEKHETGYAFQNDLMRFINDTGELPISKFDGGGDVGEGKDIYMNRFKNLEKAFLAYKERKVILTKSELKKQITFSLSDIHESIIEGEDAQNLFLLVLKANKSLNEDDRIPINEYLKHNDKDNKSVNLRTTIWDLFRRNNLIDRSYPLPIKYSINPNDVGLENLFKNIVSQDDFRLNLIGINIEGNTVTGTDGHKMLHVVGEKRGDFEDGTYIISKHGSKVSGQSIGKKIDVKYPNWKAVVPSGCYNYTIVNLPFLYVILNNIYKNGLLHPVTNQFVLKVKAFGTDDNYFFGFNASLMLDIISSLLKSGIKESKMCFEGTSKAVIFTQPSVEWENYTKETILSENIFGLAMPIILYSHSSTNNLIIDLKDLFLAEVKPYSLEDFHLTKNDVFFSISPKNKVNKNENKKDLIEIKNEKTYLKEKIKAFDDMISLTDDKEEIRYLMDKIDAFTDMLSISDNS